MAIFTKFNFILLVFFLFAGVLFFLKIYSQPQIDGYNEEYIAMSLRYNGITKFGAPLSPKYNSVRIQYNYIRSSCLDSFNEVIGNFTSSIDKIKRKKVIAQNSQFFESVYSNSDGTLIFEGSANIYDIEGNLIKKENISTNIIGIGVCSKSVLTSLFCRYLEQQPAICQIFQPKEDYTENTNYFQDSCYKCCFIEHLTDQGFLTQYWCGPPCKVVETYVPEKSKAIRNSCFDTSSCKDDSDDIACCLPTECVVNGNCYPLGALYNIGGDEQLEVCATNDEKIAYWFNPDKSKETCTQAKFEWLECQGDDCISNFINKNNDLYFKCCGDDPHEYIDSCRGEICDIDKDITCCNEESCVYNGKCYPKGCTKLLVGKEDKIVYCDDEDYTWHDLDRKFCQECLGSNAWSGNICCGDDPGEGEYTTIFSIFPEVDSLGEYYSCSQQEKDCVHPTIKESFPEGCYYFKNDTFLKGGYYCGDSIWYNLQNDSYYCQECGFHWIGNGVESGSKCCGDDPDEYFIIGNGTSACCSSPIDLVINGVCHSSKECGNNLIDRTEGCELPSTWDNIYCNQTGVTCKQNLVGSRRLYGRCNQYCQCEEDFFDYKCKKGYCNATCTDNNDCLNTEKCLLEKCQCAPKNYCGDGILQDKNDFNQDEQCEMPLTKDNPNCKISCLNKKTRKINLFGFCNQECNCEYNEEDFLCIKGMCGAECNYDGTGCSIYDRCITESCKCVSYYENCGNDICDFGDDVNCPSDCPTPCPYRVNLKVSSNFVSLDEVLLIQVAIFDKDNNPMAYAPFDIEYIQDNRLNKLTHYKTSSNGILEIPQTIKKSDNRGEYSIIVKTSLPGCNVIGDRTEVFFDVPIIKQKSAKSISLSEKDNITDLLKQMGDLPISSSCGDGLVSFGEVCEGKVLCRLSSGCDYLTFRYDLSEYCSNCNCQDNQWSNSSDRSYCNYCSHCGDGIVNCDEECETGMIKKSGICKDRGLYQHVDYCKNCKWVGDEHQEDKLIDACFCDCPEDPEYNCVQGDYIDYKDDFNAGCSFNRCKKCNCRDTYTRDMNQDGIEDKCSPEICGDYVDNNDNGIIDEEQCIWYYCSDCGHGVFNVCDKDECYSLNESCYFTYLERDYGICSPCNSVNDCNGYTSYSNCINNRCDKGNCIWDNYHCCQDQDEDLLCNEIDNCQNIWNNEQDDLDKDGTGDACEICYNEPKLVIPKEILEVSCNNKMDDDCDGLVDCQDTDCYNNSNNKCCNSIIDCVTEPCFSKYCNDNRCEYYPKNICESTDCKNGFYCNSTFKCSDPDNHRDICLLCAEDKTEDDQGIGFGAELFITSSQAKGNCCGNQLGEYYLINYKEGCCSNNTDCVDRKGYCHTNGSIFNKEICINNQWLDCGELNTPLNC